GELRRTDARADGDQELESPGRADQARRHDPCVFAGTPRGQQYAVIAQGVGRDSHLAEVIMAAGAGSMGSAQVARIAVRGNEPEDIHAEFRMGWRWMGVSGGPPARPATRPACGE